MSSITLNRKENTIKTFHIKTRRVICRIIYKNIISNVYISHSEIIEKIINDLKNINKNLDWIKKIPGLEFKDLINKLNDSQFINPLSKYIQNLVIIISKLEKLNQNYLKTKKNFNVEKFLRELKSSENLKIHRTLIYEIFNNLKTNFREFKIERVKATKKDLIEDGKNKECYRCRKIKPYKEFNKWKSKGYCHLCKLCQREVRGIKDLRNKFNIVTEIYNGKFNGKCAECGMDIKFLPPLEFHHTNSAFKTKSFYELRRKNFMESIRILENENVKLLCRNCHLRKQSKIFNYFEEVILKEDIFQYSAEDIHKLTYNAVLEHPKIDSSYRPQIKFQIIEWLKKRYIFELLYKGKCIGYVEINIYNNFPALTLHHLSNFNGDKLRWEKISNRDVLSIGNLLINENCICLCANCHRMIHAQYFERFGHKIIGEQYKDCINRYYNILRKKINDFRFETKIKIDPFKKQFGKGEVWKKYLIHINNIVKHNRNNRVDSFELAESLKIKPASVNRYINSHLKNKKLIEIIQKGNLRQVNKKIILLLPDILTLTEKSKNLIKKWQSN